MKKNKVIVVDDNKEFLDEFVETLNLNNFEATGVDNSLLALSEILKFLPDVIILDLKMKPKNGYQIAEDLKKFMETRNIPVIAITGNYKEEEHSLLLRMLGIKDRFIKPFKPEEIISKINEYLGKSPA